VDQHEQDVALAARPIKGTNFVQPNEDVVPMIATALAALLLQHPALDAADRPPLIRSGSISDADYPRAAARIGAEGTVVAALDVDERGGLTGCRIEQSGGHPALDEKTCEVAQRLRFSPARRAGQPVAGVYEFSIDWRLPSRRRAPVSAGR
jgi:TonB family protein